MGGGVFGLGSKVGVCVFFGGFVVGFFDGEDLVF